MTQSDQEKKDLRKAEQQLIRTLQPPLNNVSNVPVDEYLERQDRLYNAYENLLAVLIECAETGTEFWGNDDEDYMNVRLEHIQAFHSYVVNGDKRGADEQIADSMLFTGHEEGCPFSKFQLDETGHYKYFTEEDTPLEDIKSVLSECECEDLYERDLQSDYLIASRNFFLKEEE